MFFLQNTAGRPIDLLPVRDPLSGLSVLPTELYLARCCFDNLIAKLYIFLTDHFQATRAPVQFPFWFEVDRALFHSVRNTPPYTYVYIAFINAHNVFVQLYLLILDW